MAGPGDVLAQGLLHTGKNQAPRPISMLRITHCADIGRRIALTVEGRIAEQWVPLLEQEIAAALQAASSVEIDLAQVSYIDAAGIQMLHEIRTDGLRLTHAPAFIHALLTAAPAPG